MDTHMDTHRSWRILRTLVMLLMLAYLGFYFYGLVLGVFSPFELLGLTIIAAAAIGANIVIWLRWRFRGAVADGIDDDARSMRKYRERRGF